MLLESNRIVQLVPCFHAPLLGARWRHLSRRLGRGLKQESRGRNSVVSPDLERTRMIPVVGRRKYQYEELIHGDSRIRVVDGAMLVQKFKGFRNTSSQIAASLTANGKYVISASEDSHVYIWRHDVDSRPGRSKGAVTTTQSYEYFHCQNVTVALPWPGTSTRTSTPTLEAHSTRQNWLDEVSNSNPSAQSIGLDCQEQGDIIGHYSDRVSATWPEEKLTANNYSPQSTGDLSVGGMPRQSRSAWGMVIVTAGRRGEIRTFQNFGIPVRA